MSKKQKESNAEHKEEAAQLSPDECQALLRRVEELEAMREQMVRKAADFENARKRLEREKMEFAKFAQENFVKELLGILDNFERALSHKHDDNPESLKGVISGIEMVFKQLNGILKLQGLKRLETKDQKFDPHLHEAVAYVEEEGEEDRIVDEIQPGYTLHERLLRAAKVRVTVAPKERE